MANRPPPHHSHLAQDPRAARLRGMTATLSATSAVVYSGRYATSVHQDQDIPEGAEPTIPDHVYHNHMNASTSFLQAANHVPSTGAATGPSEARNRDTTASSSSPGRAVQARLWRLQAIQHKKGPGNVRCRASATSWTRCSAARHRPAEPRVARDTRVRNGRGSRWRA